MGLSCWRHLQKLKQSHNQSTQKKNTEFKQKQKTENLEASKKGLLLCLPGRSAQMRADTMSPKTKNIHDLRQKNEKLKRLLEE